MNDSFQYLEFTTAFNPVDIICSKLTIEILEQVVKHVQKVTIKTPERRQWRFSGVFIINFEHISHLVQASLLLTLTLNM